LKKKFKQRVSPEKKNRAQVVSKKKNSCNLKIPLPPHHFSNGPSLSVLSKATETPQEIDCTEELASRKDIGLL